MDYIFPCGHSVTVTTVTPLFCSLRAVTSSVIYYSVHKRENVIYLLISGVHKEYQNISI